MTIALGKNGQSSLPADVVTRYSLYAGRALCHS